METKITGRNIQLTPVAYNYIERKLSKLSRHLTNITDYMVEVSEEKTRSPQQRFVVQVTIDNSSGSRLRGDSWLSRYWCSNRWLWRRRVGRNRFLRYWCSSRRLFSGRNSFSGRWGVRWRQWGVSWYGYRRQGRGRRGRWWWFGGLSRRGGWGVINLGQKPGAASQTC